MKPLIAVLLLSMAQTALAQDLSGIARIGDFKAMRSSSNHVDSSSNDDSLRVLPGETVVLADLIGPGVVTHIWITVAANEYGWPRLARLQVYYDGSTTASVDAPLGDFFAVGHGLERQIQSLMVRNSSSGRSRNSYWPMPFRKACRITVTNEGRERLHALYWHVDWRKQASLADDVGYFHARYRQSIPAESKQLEILNVEGRGQYAGTVFSVVQAEPGWFGEGDERIFVDGERTPSIEGTGTEDYFNDAWSLRIAEGLYTGVPVADGTSGAGARMTAYRWHFADPIPFSRSLRFDIEHAGWTYHATGKVRSGFQERFDLFSTVAFWYQQGIAQDQPELPYGSARLPHGNARQIEAESLIADVTSERGRADVQKEVFWSRDILRFRADGPGSRVDVPFSVEREANYELVAQMAHAPDYGIYEVWLDGAPLASRIAMEHEPGANLGGNAQIDGYHTELYVAEDHLLAWRKLTSGQHILSFRCVGKNQRSTGYNLGLDTIILARIGELKPDPNSPSMRLRRLIERKQATADQLQQSLTDPVVDMREAAAWGFTQSPVSAAASIQALTKALADSDPVVRGLAAVAMRTCGACAGPALPALIVAIKDPSPNVRIASIDAVAKLGEQAAPALSALMEVGGDASQHAHVLRSVAAALGAIGPAAQPALPVLETLQKHVRVRWIAEKSIALISSQPLPAGAEPAPKR